MGFGALPFVLTELDRLPAGRALDVACGKGRHLAALLDRGFEVMGVDRDREALAEAARRAPRATLLVRDVEADGLPEDMSGTFDVVVTTFFLYRPLVPELFRALAPGGVWLLETFHVENHLRRGHPRRRAFSLEAGEARALAEESGFELVSLDEGERGDVFTARLVARRP